MKLTARAAAAALFVTILGSGAAFAAEAMCACCKDMAEKMSCCEDMKKAEQSPKTPAPQHRH
jgi:hypothetical protein